MISSFRHSQHTLKRGVNTSCGTLKNSNNTQIFGAIWRSFSLSNENMFSTIKENPALGNDYDNARAAKDAFRNLISKNEDIRNEFVYSLAFSSNKSLFSDFDVRPNALMEEQLRNVKPLNDINDDRPDFHVRSNVLMEEQLRSFGALKS